MEAASDAAKSVAADPDSDISLTSILIELTALIMMIELVVNAVRVRRLSVEQEQCT